MELTPDGEARFHRPDRRRLRMAPPPPRAVQDGKTELENGLSERGVVVDPDAGRPSWWGESVDYGWAIESWWTPKE